MIVRPPLHWLRMASEWLRDRLAAGQIQAPVVPALETSLEQLGTALGGCERIANTPIRQYANTIYLRRHPAPQHLSLLLLAAEIENPFDEDANDLALNAMSHTIEASVLELVGEPPRTTAVQARDYVLL